MRSCDRDFSLVAFFSNMVLFGILSAQYLSYLKSNVVFGIPEAHRAFLMAQKTNITMFYQLDT